MLLIIGIAAASAQQDSTASTAAASELRKDGLRSSVGSDKPVAQPRRKRGGLNSLPGDNPSATPAEGQSDLIKVLQPGQRTK